ncbi:MAG: DNA mismatch repair protein [Myxococcales bacterium]|nr:DNA mismatch repair protein [Myxococcales bacterium]
MRATPLDLLHDEPLPRADFTFLREAVAFAFETGTGGDVFERLATEMPLLPSAFDDEQFAKDVFLDELVTQCMPVVAEGRPVASTSRLLRRLVGRPPRDHATVRFRQAILRELASAPELATALESVGARLHELADGLTTSPSLRLDPNRRRLDALRSFVDVVRASCSFLRATSGLRRLGTWATRVHGSEAFSRVVELLAYEEGAAELDLRVRVGFDGRIRALAVVGVHERTQSPFHVPWYKRWAERLGLVARGYRFTDQEILARLIDEVYTGIESELLWLLLVVGDIDVYLGMLALKRGAERTGLSVCLAELGDGGERTLEGLFNPLLVADGVSVVPCDMHANAPDALTIVTGPNSGGKTRLLQSLVFAQLLGQAGFFVPARRARLPRADGLFVSLLEQSRADQREGRLGTELLRIRRLFERVGPGTLVVLDELCAGTNPSEGEEIFRLVVRLLGELRPAAFITTHLLAFAARMAEEERATSLSFLQVELDVRERPTFQFVPGVATTSLAHRTAARLGVTEESLRRLLQQRTDEETPALPS